MVRYCCICKMEYGRIQDVSIHNFPKSEYVKEKWFVNIGRKVNKCYGVCSKHFEEKDFRYKVVGDTVRRFLISGAVPTVLLPSSNRENILINNITLTSSPKHEFHSEITHDQCKEPNMPIDSECSNNVKQTTTLKRKSNESMESAKRFCNPRYIGDLRREDFISETTWKIVEEYVKTSKSQAKVLNQKVKRLNEKVETFKSLLDHLKKNDLLSNEVCNALEVSF